MSNSRWLFHLRALPHAAIAVAACAGASSALAQSAINGELLYNQKVNFPVSGLLNCADCHGPAYLFRAAGSAGAISSAINGNRGGMNAYAFLNAGQVADIAAYVANAMPPPPAPPVNPLPGSPAPVTPSATPNPVLFSSTQIGARSGTVPILFTNTGTTTVTFNNPAILGATGDAADFLVDTPPTGTVQCIAGRAMAPGTSCSFAAKFAPSAAGARSAVWTVSFTGAVAPRTLTLQGTATTTASSPAPAPAPAPAPSSANAPTSGGGGALGWTSLLGLAALSALAGTRRRARR